MRLADMPGNGPLFRDPAARGRGEGLAELHWRRVFEISDQVRREAQHHRCFPFASVSHFALDEALARFLRPGAQAPIGGEEKEHVFALAMALPQFEHRLPARHVIPSVAVHKHDPPEAVLEHIFREPIERIEIDARGRGERAGEIKMMIGIAEP